MESIAINAPGDNARRMHTYKLRIKAGHNLLTAFSKGIDAPTYLDPSWLPGRQDIIYYKRYHTTAGRVTKISAFTKVVTTNIDTIKLFVITKTNRHHLRFASRIPRNKSSPPLIVKVFSLPSS